VHLFLEPRALMPVVKVLDRLFEAHGDKEPDDDRRNMDKEASPGVRGLVRRMDVEHAWISFSRA
jgi:hypothetical protein